MRIKLEKTPEQIELIKAAGSKNKIVAQEAMEALAAFIGGIVSEVIPQASTAGLIYNDLEFDEDDDPSIPVDLYAGKGEGHVTVWSQQIAGGLASSQVTGTEELKISTYRLDSAVHFLRKYARRARLDVISKAIERMAQEVLVQQERNAWIIIMQALADAASNTTPHVIQSNTESVFVLNDLSALMTRARRINASWADGTPDAMSGRGLTDLFVSPEIKEQIRNFTSNPMNTVGSNTDIPLPDGVREQIFRSAGAEELYGINIMDLVELGTTQKYNTLFANLAPSNVGPGGNTDFVDADDEVIIGVDLSRDAFIRPVAIQSESGGQFTAMVDDQWTTRSDKQGWFGFTQEGRICIDARAILGLVV